MEEEKILTRAELQELEAKELVEEMRGLDPAGEKYATLQERYKTLMETITKERELAASEEANKNDKAKNFVTVAVTVISVAASFLFGFKTDKQSESGELPQKRQGWKIAERLLGNIKK